MRHLEIGSPVRLNSGESAGEKCAAASTGLVVVGAVHGCENVLIRRTMKIDVEEEVGHQGPRGGWGGASKMNRGECPTNPGWTELGSCV